MIKLNRESLKDKIYACWIGKNIGGTMGTPYEGRQELLDIQGFSTPAGTVLPNDDLDLQLVWLKALEERGPKSVTPQVLGEYWISYIGPHWNEYGIGKCNMKNGLQPPLSGEYNNFWKNSNGAWIRSEVWACTAPGCPDIALHYAWADACIDHGNSEGTYAELFTAAVESAAFVVQDRLELIEIGLSKIPDSCRVAKSVKIVLDCYHKGIDWKEARRLVLEDSLQDLGWFQAPANIAYTMLGLLYGEGDFKKSMMLAINCGDDTDCTGATLGSLFGIMYGTACIPEDWRRHIGDNIVTVSIDRGSCYGLPANCKDLTDHVLSMAPCVLKAHDAPVMIYEGEQELSSAQIGGFKNRNFAEKLWSIPAYSHSVDFIYATGTVEYLSQPVIQPLGTFSVKVSFYNQFRDPKHLHLKWHLPQGWSVSGGSRNLYLEHDTHLHPQRGAQATFTFTAPESVEPVNRLILEVTSPGRPTVGLLPVVLLG